MLTQSGWRKAGIGTLAMSMIMAGVGTRLPSLNRSPLVFFGYWGVFALFLLASVAIALLDLRYIRAQYAMGRREAFRQTLGDESFRASLRKASRETTPAGRAGSDGRPTP